MLKTVKARYSKGKIEPLEKVDIAEGTELVVTVSLVPPATDGDRFKRAAGAWKGLVDAEKLIKDIYADRLVSARRKPEL